ncbi:PMD domain-containing protein [Abeliophyllum distichum]|uniref:PMD domain-containing protein n=1 Tax=Abeliophyllum distichum TaxID=126358 RepID=A0ABD1SBA5_9LAMI
MATSKKPSDNLISFEYFQELLTRRYVNPSCLLSTKPESNDFYLGPSFNDADSVGRAAVAQLFPCTQEPSFLDPFPLKPICDKSICTWPKADTTLYLWHARMMKHSTTKAIFDRARIYDLLEIATRLPLYHPVLFPIALSFWSSEYNTSIFPLGPMPITLRDVGSLVNLPPLGDTIFPTILISSAAAKFDKKFTDSYLGMQELYNNSGAEPTHVERVAFLQVWLCKYVLCVPSLKPSMAYLPIAHELAHVHHTPIYVQPPLTLNEASDVLPVWAQYLVGRELFHDILIGTNAKAGVEIYAPKFFISQLGFSQTWPIPPCYSKSFEERFHTITKVEAQTMDVRSASLMNGFSLAPFNPTSIVHPLFEQFWPSVKRRLFATNVNHAFHLLKGLGPSKTSISSIPVPIPAMPISTRCPAPSSSPSKSPPVRTSYSVAASLQSSSPPAQTGVIKVVSSLKRPALGPSEQSDDNDDDDAPPLIRRKGF